MSTEFYWVAVALTTILSAARLTRLAVYDEFPPTAWLRERYIAHAPGKWGLLGLCGFCFSFWATLLVVTAGLLCHVYGHPPNDTPCQIWWIVNGVLAASYLAASYVARDGDES